MFTNEEMIKAVLENIGPCTIAEIQQIFNIPTEEIVQILNEKLTVVTSQQICKITKELAIGYALMPEKEYLINKIKELETKLAEKPNNPPVPLRIIKRVRIRFINKTVKVPETVIEKIEEPIQEELNTEEAFQQALAEINNRI